MKIKKGKFVFGLVLMIFGVSFFLSGCATVEQQQPTTSISPLHEVLYGTSLGLKESTSSKDTDSFADTRWRIMNIHPRFENVFKDTQLSFERSGIMVESAELPNGTIYTDTHRYRVVGSTLVLTKDGRTSVALFKIEGNILAIDVNNYNLTFEQIRK